METETCWIDPKTGVWGKMNDLLILELTKEMRAALHQYTPEELRPIIGIVRRAVERIEQTAPRLFVYPTE